MHVIKEFFACFFLLFPMLNFSYLVVLKQCQGSTMLNSAGVHTHLPALICRLSAICSKLSGAKRLFLHQLGDGSDQFPP